MRPPRDDDAPRRGSLLLRDAHDIRAASTVFEDRPALVLSNDQIDLTIVTEGGAMAAITLKSDKEKINRLWNPYWIARQAGLNRPASFARGHFVCIDGFGPVSPQERADGGRTFASPVRHPQIAVGPGDAITVAWDEQLKGMRRIVVAGGTSNDKNDVRFVRQLVSDEPGTYPAVASLTDAAIGAWTSGSSAESVLRVESLAMRQSREMR